jgi:methylmalonyl-CoA mutase C-terminal domain/subunit
MTAPARKIRVLVGKPGLDGHDRGGVVAMALRDAGMEVIYSGLRADVAALANAAVQESVDVIGLSILSGAHLSVCRRLFEELHRLGASIPVVLGGVIPESDHAALKKLGVAAIYGPETPLETVVNAVRKLAQTESDGPKTAVEVRR